MMKEMVLQEGKNFGGRETWDINSVQRAYETTGLGGGGKWKKHSRGTDPLAG